MSDPTPVAAPDALDASIKSARPVLTTVVVGDEEFKVTRKPPTLLVAELARTDSGNPEAIGVLAEFFEVTMGKEEYNRFKRAFYAADFDEEAEELMSRLSKVLEDTLGRPTR